MPFEPPCYAPEFFFDSDILEIIRGAMDDRVVAQQGSSYWLEPLSPGVRHLIRFEEEAAAEKLGSGT